ncbi:MAG TPA: VIT family protein [Candidatus Binatia bacterium]|nr:VIT family protein [Candidatus Binatia bacterium]
MARGPLIHRFMDPGDALGEILFGIIMSLTFTVGARFFLAKGEFDRNELIVGALGCNIAWGVIDAVLYVLGSTFFRSQRAHFYRALRNAPDEKSALAMVEEQFGLEDEPLNIPAEDRARLYQAIAIIGRRATPARIRVTRDDLVAAFLVFALVTFTAIPLVVPFLIFADESLAIRVANTVQVALLFIGGWRWGSYTDLAPWKVGLAVTALGIGMSMMNVLLGG